jgi:hypothetical protein
MRISAILVVTVVLCCMIMPYKVYAESASVNFYMDDESTAVAGQTFVVKLDITTDAELGDVFLQVRYNSDSLEYVPGPDFIIVDDNILTIEDVETTVAWNTRTYDLTFLAKNPGLSQIQLIVEGSTVYRFGSDEELSFGGVTDKTFNVLPPESQSDNAYLYSLQLSQGALIPDFSPEQRNYFADVTDEVETIHVNAVPQEVAATISQTSNAQSPNNDVRLSTGENRIILTVTAPAGNQLVYQVIVRRAEPTPVPTQSPTPTIPVDWEANWRFRTMEQDGAVYVTGQYFYKISNDFTGLDIPDGYVKDEIVIDSHRIVVYGDSDSVDVYFLMALENEAGAKGLYRYDRREKTIQAYTVDMGAASQPPELIDGGFSDMDALRLLADAIDLEKQSENIGLLSFICALLGTVCVGLLVALIYVGIRARDRVDDEI